MVSVLVSRTTKIKCQAILLTDGSRKSTFYWRIFNTKQTIRTGNREEEKDHFQFTDN